MIGIDEVGRGSWAGPLLVVAARKRDGAPAVVGLDDSKKLTHKQRQQLLPQLLISYDFGEGWVTPEEIDTLGLGVSMRLASMRALLELSAGLHEDIVFDGTINYCPSEYQNVTTMIKADHMVPAVSAASVWAKEMRDSHMKQLDKTFPHYQFSHHVGYGTAHHRTVLSEYGPLKGVHRFSFRPVASLRTS